jgi:uncharacterized protein
MTAEVPGNGGSHRPLPIRPRPVPGESTGSYVRRLALANHLRPAYLRRYLASPKDGTIRTDLLAALAGRSPAALEHALADLAPQPGAHPRRAPRAAPARTAARAALFTAIRRDAGHGMSRRALADRHGVHRRTVLQALQSPVPVPRKPLPPRKSRLEPFKNLIREMIQADPDRKRTVTSIMRELAADHNMTGISYPTVRTYVVSIRGTTRPPRRTDSGSLEPAPPPSPSRRTPATRWSPAHLAVEQQNLPSLKELLDAGHDAEDDDGHGWTLLRHAIDVEHDSHVQSGGPLHADVTAFLLARGADPVRTRNGTTIIAEAEMCGHWLAAEIMRAWTARQEQMRPAP